MNHRKLWLLLLACFAVSSTYSYGANSALEFNCSVLRPDSDYEDADRAKYWTEGWDLKDEDGSTHQFYPNDFSRGAIYEAYLTNTSRTEQVEIINTYVSGKKITEVVKPGSQVVWYRIKPQVLLPGQTAQIMMRLRDIKKMPVPVKIVTDSGQKIDFKIDFTANEPKPTISRLCMSHEMDKVYAYIETYNGDFRFKNLKFDGLDMTANTQVFEPYGGQLGLVVNLPKSINVGTEHTIIIESLEGKTALRFRCWQDDFKFSLFDGPDSESMINHNFDVVWYHQSLRIPKIMERWSQGIEVIAPYVRTADKVKNVPGILAAYMDDEPDGLDYGKFRHIKPYYRRVGMMAPEMLKHAEHQRLADQDTLNVLICDSTFKPANYLTYGRIGDLFVMDKYPVSASRQPMEVYNIGVTARRACEPSPYWVLLGCYKDPKGNWKRYPTPVEMRLMAYSAVATGAQSLGYWTYCVGSRFYGAGGDPKLYDAMGRINGEIKPVGWLLSRSQPPIHGEVVKVSEDVIADVIRGPENNATFLVLINEDHKSDKAGFDISTIKNIDVEWQIPANTKVVSLLHLSETGPKPVKFTLNKGILKLKIDEIITGGIWVAVHNQATLDKIMKISETEVK